MSPADGADHDLALPGRARAPSLFDAIFQRRARRIPGGAEKPGAHPEFIRDHRNVRHPTRQVGEAR